MFKKLAFLGAAALLGLMSTTAPSRAAALLGEIWTGNSITEADTLNAGIVPGVTPDATFNPGAINYNSNITGYTPALFLNNPVFGNQKAGFDPNGSLDPVFIRITGTVGLTAGNNAFILAHDDGIVVNITGIGTVLNQPGPTAENDTPFNVNAPATGNYAFTLTYAECCGPPAVLEWKINDVTVTNGVPEPSTWAMMIIGFAGLGYMGFRHSRKEKTLAA